MKGRTCLRRRCRTALAAWCIALAVASGVGAADWPAHRHDLARSGVTSEKLGAPLHRQWTYAAAPAPRPAWPEPGRELNRVAFDYAYSVTVAGGLAYFGSSADHKVYAIDLNTGQERWSFFTDGPVRFAPAIEGGRVFAASDDGWLYCLSADEGKLLWRFSGAPRREKIMGNEQMISRWPLRSGVAVENGIVTFSAGMWPTEGVFVYALRAADGTVVWENATSGTNYIMQPHPGSFSMTGVAPQGYLFGHEGQILIPTGRNVVAAYDRDTGKLLYYRGQPSNWGNRWGGSWNFIADGLHFGWNCHVGPDIDVLVGEYTPDPRDSVMVFDAATGKERKELRGKLCGVVSNGTFYASGSGKVTAYDLAAWLKGAKPEACTKWEAPHARAYEVIMAGDTLFVGGKGTVTAIDAVKGKVLWKDKVKGQVRNLAAADGRLLASTTRGHIVCYGAKAVANPPTIAPKGDTSPYRRDGADTEAAATARSIIKATGKKAGFCLALGAGDGRLLYHLAKHSDLIITCVEPSARKAAAARRAMDAAGLYGVRVTVHRGSLRALAYPDYFADLIIPGDGTSRGLKRCSAAELYRVLRPLGGTIHIPAAQPAATVFHSVGRVVARVGSLGRTGPFSANALAAWLRRGGVPEAETKATEGAVQVVRGKLPDTDDWTHQYASAGRTGASRDTRARLPLKLLWFGEPGPARLVTRHWGGPAPLCVNGRMFVIGQFSLMAADAYNGRQLWRRDFPRVAWWHVRGKGSSAAADADSVYLVQDKTCLRLDAATGKTLTTYQLPPLPADLSKDEVKSLKWSYLAVANGRVLGTIGNDGEARCVFVLDKGGKPLWAHALNGWVNHNSASMDDRRVYVIDRTSPADVARAKRRGKKAPASWALVALDAKTGKVAWQTTEGIAGRTELWLSDGVLVATSRSGMTGYDSANGKALYTQAVGVGRFPVIAAGTIYIEPLAYDLRTGEPKQRANPFTDGKAQWSFRRSYGCGSIAGSPTMLMFRSGTLGIYDLAGDGGVHNFGAVRAGCYVNVIAANGLLLAPPADAACTCSYSLRTTVVLAPAKTQRDWAIFYDRLPGTSVKQAAFNLGAPGDRRDQDGALWLATPRPVTRSHRRDIAIPFRFATAKGFGPYAQNPDRVQIKGTDRPWLYASGLKGLQRAELDLEVLDRGITSWPVRQPPAVDGLDADPAWDGYKAIPLAGGRDTVTLRHDDDSLYLAYKRPAADAKPWKAAAKGSDAQVWKDDSFELFLSNVPGGGGTPSKRYLHLGLSASGARYDALWTYVTPTLPTKDIPRLDAANDGSPDDWADNGLKITSLPGRHGKMRDPRDFDPSLRIGWSDKGLLLLVQVKDTVVHEWENIAELWRGDCIEIFVAPKTGTDQCLQCVVSPGSAPEWQARTRFYDHRKAKPAAKPTVQAAARKTADGYLLEVLLPWASLGITPAAGREVAVQVFVNDDDKKGDRHRFQALWHQAGNPTRDPLAYQTFRLAAKPSPAMVFTRSKRWDRQRLFTAVPPHALPITLPSLGARPEDPKHAATWAGAVRADQQAFVAELAIPWKTLTAAGLGRADLMVNVASRGPLREAPVLGRGFERLIPVPRDRAQPKLLTVRLHFAELDDVRRGQRVFDVKLNGNVVLRNFDVVRAARGRRRAVVKEFRDVIASRALTVELIPKAKELTPSSAPILSAIEILPVVGGE